MYSFVLIVGNMLLSMMDGIRIKREEEQGGGKRQSFRQKESAERINLNKSRSFFSKKNLPGMTGFMNWM